MSRMLIVDDDPAWRNLYRMTFESQFEVFEAMDGFQALSVLDAVRPDVVILDLRMPKMDGVDFIQRLQKRGVNIPIVVCSGTVGFGDRPSISGVHIAAKTPDLRDVWAALRIAVPQAAEVATSVSKPVATVDHELWRD
jgi:CheY-like chemotaxis protein